MEFRELVSRLPVGHGGTVHLNQDLHIAPLDTRLTPFGKAIVVLDFRHRTKVI
jgi:hypothetical protein